MRATQVAQAERCLGERDASACRNRRHHTAVIGAGGGFACHDLNAIPLGQRRRSVSRFRHYEEHARLERALARCVVPRFRAARIPSHALVAERVRKRNELSGLGRFKFNAVVARELLHNRFDRKRAIMLIGNNNLHLVQGLRHGNARVNGAHFFRFVNLVDIRAGLRVHDVAEMEANLRARRRAFRLRHFKTRLAVACALGHRSDHGRIGVFQQEREFIAGQPSATVEDLRARKRSCAFQRALRVIRVHELGLRNLARYNRARRGDYLAFGINRKRLRETRIRMRQRAIVGRHIQQLLDRIDSIRSNAIHIQRFVGLD